MTEVGQRDSPGEVDAISLPHRLEYLGLLILHHAILRLPFRSLRPLADMVGSLVWLVDSRGRAVAEANLRCAFPGRYSDRQIRSISRRSYATFARTMLELFWSPRLTEEFVRRHFTFSGWETDSCRTDPNRAAIYTCQHFSNFEWLGQIAIYTTARGPLIAQNFKNPLLSPFFARLRTSTGQFVIPQERAVIRMLKLLKQGGKFGMLSDLTLDPRRGGIPIRTFGGLYLSVTPSHAVLAHKTDAAIVPISIRPKADGSYHVTHHLPIENCATRSVQEIAQLCWDAMEPNIHDHPECWLWSYKHWRFKPSGPEGGRYPFYANSAGRFDRLLDTLPGSTDAGSA